jgi:uncharacterized membrane protein YdcZ (DUF606 family)
MPPLNLKTLDGRYRVMLVLWFALFSTLGVYSLVSLFIHQPNPDDSQSRILTFAFTTVGTLIVVVSIAVKQKFLAQAIEKQQIGLVLTGLIVGMALCEAAALFGLMDRLITGNRYYFVLLIIAGIGMFLHFPRRESLEAASYKQTGSGMENY